MQIGAHRMHREVAELHVFHHALAQGCHGQASHLHAWTPSGQNGDDRSAGVTLLTEESLWSRYMPEARWAQRWRGWEERKALYPNAVSGFVQEGLSEVKAAKPLIFLAKAERGHRAKRRRSPGPSTPMGCGGSRCWKACFAVYSAGYTTRGGEVKGNIRHAIPPKNRS